MGFKMKGSPINLGPGLLGKQLISGIGKAFSSLADNDERYAREKAKYGDTSKIKGSFKGVNIEQRLKDVNRPETQQLINKFKNPSTPPKSSYKGSSTEFDRFTNFAQPKIKTVSTATSNNSGVSDNYTQNINNKTQKRKEAEAKYLKSTDSKAPKVDKVLSKRELRLENVKRKAANEKAKTNKTAQSIDASKPTSADTKAKQTSAKSSRAKAKRLENRAARIQGRIDRKGKSSAEKRASRKATRQKIRENR